MVIQPRRRLCQRAVIGRRTLIRFPVHSSLSQTNMVQQQICKFAHCFPININVKYGKSLDCKKAVIDKSFQLVLSKKYLKIR